MINVWKELSSKKILNEGCLYEGTHYDKEAAKILAEVCNTETAEKIIDLLIKKDWVSIFTHTNWIYKFLKPVARIFVEETKKGKSLADAISYSLDTLGQFLVYVKNNQDKKDDLFNLFNTWSLSDVEKFLTNIQVEMEKAENEQEVELSGNNYKIVKIDSYEQLHQMFGGKWTGDGKSDKAANNVEGEGKTAWCHANSVNSYNIHTHDESRLMFVAYVEDWKNIPPIKTEGFPLDTYGLSLIAILTDYDGTLKEVTIRWNHIGVKNADNVFLTWGQLNKACNQDIKKECEKYFGANPNNLFVIKDGVVNKKVVNLDSNGPYTKVIHYDIPDGVKEIGHGAFLRCSNLQDVTIPNTVTHINFGAFAHCKKLHRIVMPDSITDLDMSIFMESGLTEIKLSQNIKEIPDHCFEECELKEITIPKNCKRIGYGAFKKCDNLKTVYVPENIKIMSNAFDGCPEDLQIIKSQIG